MEWVWMLLTIGFVFFVFGMVFYIQFKNELVLAN